MYLFQMMKSEVIIYLNIINEILLFIKFIKHLKEQI